MRTLEPPSISSSQPMEYTFVQDSPAELKCLASGHPTPRMKWLRHGVSVDEVDARHTQRADGALVISRVSEDDLGYYTCVASNPAGTKEVTIFVKVVTPPEIADSEDTETQEVHIGSSFSLYCPVFSTPTPEVLWEFNGKPIAEDEQNVVFSDDHRRLRVAQSDDADAGEYRCVAKNAAGSTSKTFYVEVLVPPRIDESVHKKRVVVTEGQRVELACPVSGTPAPAISWLANMHLLEPDVESRGVTLGASGKTVLIPSVDISHSGTYICVASSKAGNLDIDVELEVLAVPKLGQDEFLEVLSGKPITLICDVQNEDSKTSIVWLF
ncbi:CRE-HIM-4 protein, partial [Aphelenchoides avenae]